VDDPDALDPPDDEPPLPDPELVEEPEPDELLVPEAEPDPENEPDPDPDAEPDEPPLDDDDPEEPLPPVRTLVASPLHPALPPLAHTHAAHTARAEPRIAVLLPPSENTMDEAEGVVSSSFFDIAVLR